MQPYKYVSAQNTSFLISDDIFLIVPYYAEENKDCPNSKSTYFTLEAARRDCDKDDNCKAILDNTDLDDCDASYCAEEYTMCLEQGPISGSKTVYIKGRQKR